MSVKNEQKTLIHINLFFPLMYECMQQGSLHCFVIVCAHFYCSKIIFDAVIMIVKALK